MAHRGSTPCVEPTAAHRARVVSQPALRVGAVVVEAGTVVVVVVAPVPPPLTVDVDSDPAVVVVVAPEPGVVVVVVVAGGATK